VWIFDMGKDNGSKTAPDTILTDSSTRVLDALCEGKIKGLVAGAKSIYLGKVPIQNADGTFNFQAEGAGVAPISGSGQSVPGLFSYAITPGSNDQPPIPGFGSTESETSVNQEVKYSIGPVVQTITTPNIDAVTVTIGIPRLIRYDDDGKEYAHDIYYRIWLKVNAGVYVLQHDVALYEKSSGGFEVQKTVNIPENSSQIEIKVERLSADSNSDKVVNGFYWKSYTTILYDKFNYPNTALVGLAVNSKILGGSVKERRYHIDGTEVNIPNNATVQTDGSLIYTGAWNGTFAPATWCADPAWCLYDLIINNRYGVSIPEPILAMSRWDYYQASIWCNQMVTDGAGGVEPRFLLNVVIDRADKATRVINQLAGVFGGLFFLLNGSLPLRVDAPVSPVALLTNENASFNYQSTALRKRYTVALVSWNNPLLLGEDDSEVVEDGFGLARYGQKEIRIDAIGCTRRSQARRYGLWFLFTNRLQANSLVCTTNIYGAMLLPGDVVEVADRNKRGFILGRLNTANASSVTLDQPVELSTAYSWTITCQVGGSAETRLLQPTTGSPTANLNLSFDFSATPVVGSVWVIRQQSGVSLPQYQLLEVTPEASGRWKLVLIKYDPSKWSQIDSNLLVDEPPANNLPTIANKPRNLAGFPIATSIANPTTEKLIAQWDYPILSSGAPDPYTRSYLLSYREAIANQWMEVTTTDRSVEISSLSAGFYWLKVVAYDSQGRKSLDISVTEAVPVNVTINLSSQWSIVNTMIFLAFF
jgi:predicted phage tail protein